jgi:hypothetical protein
LYISFQREKSVHHSNQNVFHVSSQKTSQSSALQLSLKVENATHFKEKVPLSHFNTKLVEKSGDKGISPATFFLIFHMFFQIKSVHLLFCSSTSLIHSLMIGFDSLVFKKLTMPGICSLLPVRGSTESNV